MHLEKVKNILHTLRSITVKPQDKEPLEYLTVKNLIFVNFFGLEYLESGQPGDFK